MIFTIHELPHIASDESNPTVLQIGQAGPGPGFGFLDVGHAMVVGAAQLHVHRLAAVAVADHDGASLEAGFPSVSPWPGLFDIRQSAGKHLSRV